MLRVKIAGGILSPEQLRAIGEISNVHGRGEGELTTRQNVQLHYIELGALPDVFDAHARGRAHLGRRVRRHRAQHHRLPGRRARARRAVRPDAGARRGGRVLLRQPRLLRPAAQAQDLDHRVPRRLRGAGDQLHRARRARSRTGARASASSSAAASRRCRGSRATSASGSPKDDAVTVLAAILDEWREDLRYRVSRVKSRLKFMIDDIGPEGMRERVETRLGRTLRGLHAAARCRRRATTSACTSSRRPALRRRPGAPRADQRRPDDRARRPRREPRRRRAADAPAEPRAHERRGRPARRRDASSPRSACRSTPARCAATRSRAPASRTATSRSPRRSRAWTGSCSCSRSGSARTPTACA